MLLTTTRGGWFKLCQKDIRKRLEYSINEVNFLQQLCDTISGLTLNEFQKWLAEGRFDFQIIDGEKYFFKSSLSNLFFRYPILRERMINKQQDESMSVEVLKHVRNVQQISKGGKKHVRLSRTTKNRHTITLNSTVATDCNRLSCWIPFPIITQDQDDIFLISSFPNQDSVFHSEKATSGSLYFEILPQKDDIVFQIEYSSTFYSEYREFEPDIDFTYQEFDENIEPYTKPTTHINFNDILINLASKIVGSSKNPYIIGKLIYNWICENIKYSYSHEYSTISDISLNCFKNGYGDCGEMTLLFISLCRICGIGARWQSGFLTFSQKQIPHDWAKIFIQPFGWIPVDLYMGVYFKSIAQNLNNAERKQLIDFYYGNIDNYRVLINTSHCSNLTPSKKFERSDPVDFQRGEIESDLENLYFDKWDFKFESVSY